MPHDAYDRGPGIFQGMRLKHSDRSRPFSVLTPSPATKKAPNIQPTRIIMDSFFSLLKGYKKIPRLRDGVFCLVTAGNEEWRLRHRNGYKLKPSQAQEISDQPTLPGISGIGCSIIGTYGRHALFIGAGPHEITVEIQVKRHPLRSVPPSILIILNRSPVNEGL